MSDVALTAWLERRNKLTDNGRHHNPEEAALAALIQRTMWEQYMSGDVQTTMKAHIRHYCGTDCGEAYVGDVRLDAHTSYKVPSNTGRARHPEDCTLCGCNRSACMNTSCIGDQLTTELIAKLWGVVDNDWTRFYA